MNITKLKIQSLLFLFIFSFSLITYFNGCDDSGTIPVANNVSFTYTKLKHLDPTTDGMYECWVVFQDSTTTNISCGKFNIDPINGNIVDANGNAATLRMRYKPANYSTATIFGLLTIEPPNDNDTIPALHLLGGDVTSQGDFLVSSLTMTHFLALGTYAQQFPTDSAKFMLDSPTDTNETQWYNGVWLDTSSTASLHGLPVLPDNYPWVYYSWIQVVGSSPSVTKVGWFTNPYIRDDDGPGPYAGPDSTIFYQRPGQDWLKGGSPISDLRNSYYRLMICLEPRPNGQFYANGLTSHFLILFFGNSAIGSRGQTVVLPNAIQQTANYPTATMKVSSK